MVNLREQPVVAAVAVQSLELDQRHREESTESTRFPAEVQVAQGEARTGTIQETGLPYRQSQRLLLKKSYEGLKKAFVL